MAIGLFKKPRIVRKYGEQSIVNGYASAPYEDVSVNLDIQQMSNDELRALPEGERTVKRIKSYGSGKLTAADDTRGIRGDMVFYRDQWYECISSFLRENTFLKHYRSEFVLVPHTKQPSSPAVLVSPPPEDEPPEEEGDEP